MHDRSERAEVRALRPGSFTMFPRQVMVQLGKEVVL